MEIPTILLHVRCLCFHAKAQMRKSILHSDSLSSTIISKSLTIFKSFLLPSRVNSTRLVEMESLCGSTGWESSASFPSLPCVPQSEPREWTREDSMSLVVTVVCFRLDLFASKVSWKICCWGVFVLEQSGLPVWMPLDSISRDPVQVLVFVAAPFSFCYRFSTMETEMLGLYPFGFGVQPAFDAASVAVWNS